jgi:hypothetical protein
MTIVIAVIVAVAALFGGMITSMFGAMGVLFGAVLLAASSVIFMFIPAI